MYQELVSKKKKIAVVGMGYVGLPLAAAFSKKGIDTIGFDLNSQKIAQYKNGIDPTGELGSQALKALSIEFTSNPEDLKKASFFIVAVPTPVNKNKIPDLKFLHSASELIGKSISKGSYVVFESTVYPGATEEDCAPIIEKFSGMKAGPDFKIGYSPERINPGDKEHRIENIVKIVSGMDVESLDLIARVYELVVEVGVHRAESIRVAEAAKVIENAQRDINIAFMNELSLIFHKMNINTKAVLEAAGTKWNFLKFYPGLVGGHCIGVDPYYLSHKAEENGYSPEVILAGRRVNDSMGPHIAEQVIKKLIRADRSVKGARVGVFGLTFKENVGDVRNSKVVDIVNSLKDYGVETVLVDPKVSKDELLHEYGLKLNSIDEAKNLDALVLAVGHREFKEMTLENFSKILKSPGIFFDVKGLFSETSAKKLNMSYWSL
jgi:UDP-N-acetyl-D-galactosamine dehydrogenase